MGDEQETSAATTDERRREMRERAARFFRPMPEEDDLTEWKSASLERKGAALAGLLRLVKAIGNYPPKRTQFPGWKRILAQRSGRGR